MGPGSYHNVDYPTEHVPLGKFNKEDRMKGYLKLINSHLGESNKKVGPGSYEQEMAFPWYKKRGVKELKSGQNFGKVKSRRYKNYVNIRVKSTPKNGLDFANYDFNNMSIKPLTTKINPKYFLAEELFPKSTAFDSTAVRIVPHHKARKNGKIVRKSRSVIDIKLSNDKCFDLESNWNQGEKEIVIENGVFNRDYSSLSAKIAQNQQN